MRIAGPAATAIVVTTFVTIALALPRPGEPFPRVTAQELVGQVHSTDELAGHRTLLVAITDRDGGNAMEDWFKAADTTFPPASRENRSSRSKFLLRVDGASARQSASASAPAYWPSTLLDRGDIAKRVGLEQARTPYVFVLDERGGVVAAVHATADAPQAREIWNAFAPR